MKGHRSRCESKPKLCGKIFRLSDAFFPHEKIDVDRCSRVAMNSDRETTAQCVWNRCLVEDLDHALQFLLEIQHGA